MNTVDPISMILAALTLTAFCYYGALDYAEGLYALHTCKVKVDAILIGINEIKTERCTRESDRERMPVFCYVYNGVNYTSQSQRMLFALERRRYYGHEGEHFTIRIDKDNPRKCVQGSYLEPTLYFIAVMLFMTLFFKQCKLL